MNNSYYAHVDQQINEIIENKLYKSERIIVNPQNPRVVLKNGSELINFCANNYLGLADDQDVIECAKQALEKYGCSNRIISFVLALTKL